MTCYIVHIAWLYIGHFCYATGSLPPSAITLTAVPRRWLPSSDGETKEPIPLVTLDTLRCIIQSGMFGDNGNQPSQSAISRMKDNVLFLVLGGCHTLTAWRAAKKDSVRLSHVVVDSDYIGAFREDHWLPQVNDVYTEPIIFISSYLHSVPVCARIIVAESGGGVYVIFCSPCQIWKTSCVEQLLIQFTLWK
jgi:hypothetical protein